MKKSFRQTVEEMVEKNIKPQIVDMDAVRAALGDRFLQDENTWELEVPLGAGYAGATLEPREHNGPRKPAAQTIQVINGVPKGSNIHLNLLDNAVDLRTREETGDPQFNECFNDLSDGAFHTRSHLRQHLVHMHGELTADGKAVNFRSVSYFGQNVGGYEGSAAAVLEKLKEARLAGRALTIKDAQFSAEVDVQVNTKFRMG